MNRSDSMKPSMIGRSLVHPAVRVCTQLYNPMTGRMLEQVGRVVIAHIWSDDAPKGIENDNHMWRVPGCGLRGT
ncbi:hypothetical protein SAMN03159488_02106 [Pseudomonas sp. NFIX10]|nr:hypothetical protein SAMN03159488_02106 [Pseudomonas sp. NFIX10]SFE72115.1 hypothetical protein SAMN03159367_01898 [Pseudomonas sp. NFACC06-1]